MSKAVLKQLRCALGLSKWVNVVMLGAGVLTVEEGTYKYGKGEGKKLPCEDGLELEILL